MSRNHNIEIAKVIKLQYPIKDADGKDIAELQIRRAKVADMREVSGIKGSDADKEIYMLAKLTGLVPEDLDQLDISDYFAAQKVLVDMQKGK